MSASGSVPISAAIAGSEVDVYTPAGDGPFPVVVVSHGAGGDWDTHLVQAKHLASHGYAVLCLEHVGSNRERMGQGLQMMKLSLNTQVILFRIMRISGRQDG